MSPPGNLQDQESPPTRDYVPEPERPSPPDHPERIGRYRIVKVLGEGGFGRVYLAHDDELHRAVAIKVPRPERLSRPEDAEAYLAEARIVASLDHPNIVPVYDVGTADGLCFVVSKLIEGSDLAHRIRRGPMPHTEAAELVATAAEALHHAHRRGLVHRDIKPANILLDTAGKPYVADFGLALKEVDIGKGARFAGTPAYMSPEQARGEGHRVDGRSDVFSLGVVFYELLTGRRPFHGDSQRELLEQVCSVEARPPRQWVDAIPKELERICLKALSKRAADRYTTAKDFADDLRHFLVQAPAAPPSVVEHRGLPPPGSPTTPTAPETPSDQRPLKIVPKGLRSFDAHDADFFLELLPGPRDRDGLPDSIRFWKTRIEEHDADNMFSVGLIYGPSGCGKSSLVKAGLLPRLAETIIPVYLEATAEETETRLLNGLRKRCPALPPGLGLKDTLAALRRGVGIPGGKKVLIVLDQFEQWLHAKRSEENTELVQALRQCDGGHLQCVVMVRDDFWMAATRFMRDLEVRLVEAQNSAAVDLFPIRHGQQVLAAFGRAFGALLDKLGKTSKEQTQFLEQATQALAQEGKIICVRLALFAEMMKGRPWSPASLKAVGGADGIGATFLEDTFSASTAPPEHRYHQKAARAVLQALLPESGSDIKGHMRSYAELLEASGYANRPKEFDDLLRILDGELRLITPTDPEGAEVRREEVEREVGRPSQAVQEGTGWEARPTAVRYYQLTHDYLVPSLRDWLTRKQKETRRGRAELLLADRAAVWNARPENRQLPSLVQWVQIRTLTQKKAWTPPQRKMMRKAARYHTVRGLTLAVLLIALSVTGLTIRHRVVEHGRANHAVGLVFRLTDAETAQVPHALQAMEGYRDLTEPLVRELLAKSQPGSREYVRACLALLPSDPSQAEYLGERMLEAPPQELAVIRDELRPYQEGLRDRLWTILEDRKADLDRRFRAACALAAYGPDDARWQQVSADVAARLTGQNPLTLGAWAELLEPIGTQLLPPLVSFLEDEERSVADRNTSATLYKIFAKDRPEAYAPLEEIIAKPDATPGWDDARAARVNRQVNVAVALASIGRADKVWPLLKHTPDPTVRSYLIERIAPGGVEPRLLVSRFDQEQDVTIRRALLLSLGQYGLDRLPPVERQNLLPKLLQLYRDDPDAGIHGAVAWLLRQWGALAELKKIDTELASRGASAPGVNPSAQGVRRWFINSQGQTFTIIPTPGGFELGDPGQRTKHSINRTFAIATQEVSVEQFLRFRPDQRQYKASAPTADCPMTEVSWYDAAAYCNWLSDKEGIPKDQLCYEPNEKGEYAEGMKLAANYLTRTGYRLPTEVEWEYACRAGAESAYDYGEGEDLLRQHAWYLLNSLSRTGSVGQLKPNDLGLFDMHGNVWEWCQDQYETQVGGAEKKEDKEGPLIVVRDRGRVLRGGAFINLASNARSSYRPNLVPAYRSNYNGFRPARTFR